MVKVFLAKRGSEYCPTLATNVLALGAVADFGAKSCQVTTKADARHNVELTTKTVIEPNACYQQPFIQIINLKTTICQEK